MDFTANLPVMDTVDIAVLEVLVSALPRHEFLKEKKCMAVMATVKLHN